MDLSPGATSIFTRIAGNITDFIVSKDFHVAKSVLSTLRWVMFQLGDPKTKCGYDEDTNVDV